MPQLDLAFFPSQILWLIVSFMVLYLFSKHLILPKIENIISMRFLKINEDLKEASKLRDEAMVLQQKLDQKEQDTHDLLIKMQAEITTKFAEDKTEQITKLHQEASNLITKATQEINQAMQESREDIGHYAVGHAQTIISNITGIATKIEDLNKIYKEVIKND